MRLLLLLFLSFSLGTAQAAPPAPSQGGGGIVSGNGIGVAITAPSGWIFDSQSGVAQGLRGVLYPAGSSWGEATAVMYVNFADLAPEESLAAFIGADTARFKERSANLQVESAPSLPIRGSQSTEVRYFTDHAGQTYEAVAYLNQKTKVVIFALSCLSQESFQQALPAFKTLVGNSFLAKPAAEKKPAPAATPPAPAK